MIKENLKILKNRAKPPIYEEIEITDDKRKLKRKYYRCDYCGEKIYKNTKGK